MFPTPRACSLDKTPAGEGKVGTNVQPHQEAMCNQKLLGEGKSVFSNGVILGLSAALQGRPQLANMTGCVCTWFCCLFLEKQNEHEIVEGELWEWAGKEDMVKILYEIPPKINKRTPPNPNTSWLINSLESLLMTVRIVFQVTASEGLRREG